MKNTPEIESLAALVQNIVAESGAPREFDARRWLDGWLGEKVPALGHQRPADVLQQPGGLARVKQLLAGMQSGAFF